jgi:GNAT superfamily N-acetyltransferase
LLVLIDYTPSEEDMKIVKKGLEDFNKTFPNGGLDIPTPDISLILRNEAGAIIGGVITRMLVGVMHLEVLWVDKPYRRQGLGRALITEAERIGKKKGYSTCQTWTFDFQGPEFYQSIGFHVLGICDVYTDGITEYVLMKYLDSIPTDSGKDLIKQGFSITEDPSRDAMNTVQAGLTDYVNEQVGDLRKQYPELEIKLVLKTEENEVIGGILGETTLGAMYIARMWVHEEYRNQGHGGRLLLAAEKKAHENGCQAALLPVYSFQSLKFFQKNGYVVFGVSDGYPSPIKEYYLQKRFRF